MAPKGRPPGSARDREAWRQVLADYREAEGIGDAIDERRAARAAAAQRARDAKKARAGPTPPRKRSDMRPWLNKEAIASLAAGAERLVPFVPLPFASELSRLLPEVRKRPRPETEGFGAVARDLFCSGGHMKSCTLAAQDLGVDRKRLCQDRKLLASSFVCADILAREELEKSVAMSADKLALVCYVDYEKYDEVSMPSSSKSACLSEHGLVTRDALTSDAELAVVPVERQLAMSFVMSGCNRDKDTGNTKMVNSTSTFGMLVATKPEADEDKQFFMIFGDTIHGLQCCDKVTARVMRHLIHCRSSCSLGANSFQAKIRCASVDHHPSNLQAERQIQADRGWLSFVIGCEVHTVANIHKHALAPLQSTISGILHLGLSVALGGLMDKFRRCLRSVIAERLDYPPVVGHSSLETTRHRLRAIAAMTIGWSRVSALQRRVILQLLPAGDWTDVKITTFLRPGETVVPDEATYRAEVSKSMATALVWHKFAIYRQDRWFGAEQCVAQPALLLLCHGLLEPAYERFCQQLGYKKEDAMGRGGSAVQLLLLLLDLLPILKHNLLFDLLLDLPRNLLLDLLLDLLPEMLRSMLLDLLVDFLLQVGAKQGTHF